jgi:hypothetical protein
MEHYYARLPGQVPAVRRPTPAELGLGVTIGIAARALNCIVMASDLRASFGDDLPAADMALLKQLYVTRHWRTVFAADDAGAARPVLHRVHEILAQPTSHNPESSAQVRQAFREAYQQERRQQVTDSILSPYDLTLEQFKALGYKTLGPEFTTVGKALRAFDLKVEFLVCGFPEEGMSELFTISNPGVIHNPALDYWAVGSGFYMALQALVKRSLLTLPIQDVVYRVCEAKFSAESARGVGPDTVLTVLHRTGILAQMGPDEIKAMRERWEASRKEEIPEDLGRVIKSALERHGINPLSAE